MLLINRTEVHLNLETIHEEGRIRIIPRHGGMAETCDVTEETCST